jgi:hypothetical protein
MNIEVMPVLEKRYERRIENKKEASGMIVGKIPCL